MIVEYVNPVNLSILEDAYNSGIANTKDITKDFGKNLYLLLSHIKISFIVNEISILEAYMLKKFSVGNLIDLESYIEDENIDINKYPVSRRNLQSLFLLNKNINDDNDVEIKPGVMLFPTKCINKKCLVTFQGQNILSVIGSIIRGPECFFSKVTSNIQTYPDKSKEDIINDLLIESFVKEFYTFMQHKLQYMDILTDSTLDFNYLNYAKDDINNLVSLSHVNSIYGDIQFINITNEKYSNAINIINSNKKLIDLPNKSMIMDSTEIFFVCNTSFYTFMESFIYLPIGRILESTDIKIVYSSDQFIIPKEMLKYQSRIANIIDKMRNERISVSKDNNIDNYNLIPLNTRIQYTIKFKISEISNILMNWEDNIKNNHMYGNENDYLSKEILKIIDVMKNYAIAVYKTIIN